jgi:hypothetical protein
MTLPRIKAILLSLTATLTVGAAASASAASLPTQGPFWHVNGSKLPIGASDAVTGKLVTGTTAKLFATVGNLEIALECTEAKVVSASISNSSQQGQSEATVDFEKCKLSQFNSTNKKYEPFTGCEVKEPIKSTAGGSLWYLTRNGPPTERTATIQGLGLPGAGIAFAKVILKEGCGAAAGIHECEGNGAVNGSPQYTETRVGKLISPTTQIKHLWRPTSSSTFTETQVEQIFEHEARTEGEAEVELTSGDKFGAFE